MALLSHFSLVFCALFGDPMPVRCSGVVSSKTLYWLKRRATPNRRAPRWRLGVGSVSGVFVRCRGRVRKKLGFSSTRRAKTRARAPFWLVNRRKPREKRLFSLGRGREGSRAVVSPKKGFICAHCPRHKGQTPRRRVRGRRAGARAGRFEGRARGRATAEADVRCPFSPLLVQRRHEEGRVLPGQHHWQCKQGTLWTRCEHDPTRHEEMHIHVRVL